jgi:hypothetical protein
MHGGVQIRNATHLLNILFFGDLVYDCPYKPEVHESVLQNKKLTLITVTKCNPPPVTSGFTAEC